MRRRRNRSSNGDSLELLLDTICNTFGGIVFIALLIVLLLRETGTRQTDEPVETASPAEVERLAGELESVTVELASLRTAEADLARRAAAFAPDEVRELLEKKDVLAAKTGELRSERDRRIAKNATAAADVKRGESDLQKRVAQLPEMKVAVAGLEAELEVVRQSKVEEIRNPLVRRGRAANSVGLVVRYGRRYVWHRYTESGLRLGLNTDEFVVVSDEADRAVVHPDPTKGVPLTPGEATERAIRERLRRFPSSGWRCEIVVRPDSFEQFKTLRDALIAAGYEYRLLPTDGPVVDRGGSDGRVQ